MNGFKRWLLKSSLFLVVFSFYTVLQECKKYIYSKIQNKNKTIKNCTSTTGG